MTAAEGLEVLRTPAFRAALATLMAAGTWVARDELVGCSQSPVALDDALADLVMLGTAEYLQGAGYRLKQPAVVRQAARVLLENPQLQERVDMRQVAGGLQLGIAKRTGPGAADVVMCAMLVAAPDGASDDECLTHAVSVHAAVGRVWDQEERRGRASV